MSSTNPITGDKIQTKTISDQYRNNFDAIFRNKAQSMLQSDSQPTKEDKLNETQKNTD